MEIANAQLDKPSVDKVIDPSDAAVGVPSSIDKSNDLSTYSIDDLGDVLLAQASGIHVRMQALFYLRSEVEKDEAAGVKVVGILSKALVQKDDSSLLRHELAYVLGQLELDCALPTLTCVLRDLTDDPVVRHECCEAIGAIGKYESLPLLEQFVQDERIEVRETCEIAIERLKYLEAKRLGNNHDTEDPGSLYKSVDPAPPEEEEKTVPDYIAALMDTKLPLFKRYRAMFSLRNIGSEEAVLGLAQGLSDESALFAHECAYVLGQMEHKASIPALVKCLEDESGHGMLRHEAAEALAMDKSCVEVLKRFMNDPDPLVAESCVTALGNIDYWETFGGDEEQS